MKELSCLHSLTQRLDRLERGEQSYNISADDLGEQKC